MILDIAARRGELASGPSEVPTAKPWPRRQATGIVDHLQGAFRFQTVLNKETSRRNAHLSSISELGRPNGLSSYFRILRFRDDHWRMPQLPSYSASFRRVPVLRRSSS
jgi:hypothetical protein